MDALANKMETRQSSNDMAIPWYIMGGGSDHHEPNAVESNCFPNGQMIQEELCLKALVMMLVDAHTVPATETPPMLLSG
uniref:Uncharacterized protein n=1 Tax=Romanomermis culicivorax TaxID=13658 RepID=A0A915HP31_ROMCU